MKSPYGGLGAFAPPPGWNPPHDTAGAATSGDGECAHGKPLRDPCWDCHAECTDHPSPFPHLTYTRLLSRKAARS